MDSFFQVSSFILRSTIIINLASSILNQVYQFLSC